MADGQRTVESRVEKSDGRELHQAHWVAGRKKPSSWGCEQAGHGGQFLESHGRILSAAEPISSILDDRFTPPWLSNGFTILRYHVSPYNGCYRQTLRSEALKGRRSADRM